MARNEIVLKILELLQAGAEGTAEIIDVLTSGYGVSYRKAHRSIRYGPRRFKARWAERYSEQQRFYSLLNQLKRQGLVERRKQKAKRTSMWTITEAGLEKMKHYRINVVSYQKEPSRTMKVVIFDVPERYRRKRAWLRSVLLELGFSLLQQSVWVGKVKIPEEFVRDLREQHMLDYVHIFSLGGPGSITRIS